MDATTKELFKKYKTIKKQIEKLENEAEELLLQLNQTRFGYRIGDEIEHQGIKGKVCNFSYYWVAFRPYKKDGTLHKYTKTAYDIKAKFELS